MKSKTFLQSIFLVVFCFTTPLFSQQVYVDFRQSVGYVGVPIPLTVIFQLFLLGEGGSGVVGSVEAVGSLEAEVRGRVRRTR